MSAENRQAVSFAKKIMRHHVYLIFLLASLLQATPSFSEGTKELAPTAAEFNRSDMQIFDVSGGVSRTSMTYIAPADKRMYIEILNPGEEVYFGFNFLAAQVTGCNTLWYRIKDPTGAIVFGPQQVTNGGPGSIGSYAQAQIGPNTLIGGAGGYTPLSFTPTMGGSFYIEFNNNNPNVFVAGGAACVGSVRQVRIPLFDISVADFAGGNKINGRLWSQAWDLITGSFTNPFRATMYVYADDGIVTSLNFNSILPHGFIISCNRTGVNNTGNFNIDRQSVVGNQTYPQYKIFLNPPEVDAFPTGSFGGITGPVTITGCDANNRCINVPVDKGGESQLILDFNGIPGYQPATTDVLLSQTLIVGSNCIPWNGRDGLGNVIPTGGTLPMILDYFNGLTNLPLFDVENHPNGFIVNLVRPVGPQPKIFFDDSNIPGGTVNLTGCTPGVPPLGCHRWSGNIAPNGVTAVPSGQWGDSRTINTWWYANIINVTADYTVPGTISVDANTGLPGLGAANNQTICTNSPAYQLAGSVSGTTTTGAWTSSSGNVAGFSNPAIMNGTYTPSALDYTNGSVMLRLTSTGNGACPAVLDSMRLSFIGGPTVNAGGPLARCSNNAVIANLGGSFTVATGVQWTGGTAANYTPNTTTATAQYTPTPAEIAAGVAGTPLVLTLTTTGNGICPAAVDTKTITFTAAPTLVMGADQSVCANNSVANITATPTNATTLTWTGGAVGSSFGNSAIATTTYTPAPSETGAAPTSVVLTLTATKATCTNVTGTLNVGITPTPIVSAGPNRTICANDSINLVGSLSNAPTATWTSPTGGQFIPSATSLNTFYKPSAADIASGTVILSLTSSGNNCTPVVSTMTLTVTPAPTINAGLDAIVCANTPTTSLTAVSANASGVLWYNGLGTYAPSNTATIVTTYTLSAAEITAGLSEIVVQTTGTCPSVTDTVFVFVVQPPTVDAGPPLTSCVNSPIVNIVGASTSATNMQWTSAGVGAFSGGGVTANPAFSPSATEITNGTATLTLTASIAGCAPVFDVTTLTITPTPIVSAGPDRTVCSNNAVVVFNGTVTNATSLTWTSNGDGAFTAPGTGLTPTYTPGPTDLTGVPVTITARSTGNGTCTQVSDVAILTIYAAPTIPSLTAPTVCANNSLITLGGSTTNATTTTWSGGAGGSFSAINNINSTYTPTVAESVPGSITFTLTATRVGCTNVTRTVTANITASPTVFAGADRTVCGNNAAVVLAGTRTIASGIIWTGGSGTFTLTDNTTLGATYTPTAAEITAGTVNLTITTTGNGNCVAVNDVMRITINPAPIVDAGADRTICGLNPAVAISATLTNVASGTWTIITGGGTFANANSSATTYTATATDISNGFVDLRFTSTAGLCNSVFDDIHINFTPVPSANAGIDQTACTTEFPVQLNGAGSAGTWTGGGTFSNATALNSTYTPSAAEIAALTATLTYSTTATAFCPAVVDQMTITIVNGPIVNAGVAATICGTQPTITLAGTVTNAPGGVWSTINGTGSFSSTTALNAVYTISPADVTRGFVTITLTNTGNVQCNPASSTVIYTLLPAIAANAGPDQTLCADIAGITLNGAVTTATGGTWSVIAGAGTFNNANLLNATFTPTPVAAGVYTLRLTTTGNGACPAQTDDISYTLTTAPTVSAGAPITICGDSAFVVLNGSFTIATGIQWSIITGTGTFSPDNLSINSRYIPSAADRTAGTVTLRATTTGNGTCNPVTSNVTITITLPVTISAGPDQTKCANNAVTTLAASVSGATATGTWTSSSGNAAGFASLTNPTTTYTPSATDISNTTVTLTWTATGIGTCKPAFDRMIISITPAPIVNAGLDLNSCANAITTGGVALNGSVSAGATTGIWTASSVGGSFSASSSVLNANYIPNATDTTTKTVTLTLTSTANGTCTAVTDQVIVTFTAMPVVNAGTDVTICADQFSVPLTGIVANEPAGGIWTSSSVSASFLPSTITLNGNFVPSATDRTNGATVTITLTSSPTGPCPAVTDNMVVTINKAPTVNAGPDITVCANNALVNLSGSFTIATGVQWVSNGTTPIPGNTLTSTSFTPNALDISASPLTITLTSTGNGLCNPVTDQLTLTITPAPVVNAGADQTICADLLGTPLSGSVSGGTTTGTWTAAPAGGTFGANANTLNATFFPSAANKTAGSVTLTLTSTGNGLCNVVTDQMVININAAPTVTAGPDATICADGTTTLAGTSTLATGVTWTTAGDGTFSPNIFTPGAVYTPGVADTTAGTVVLTITAINSGNTCNAVTDQMTVNIDPIPVVFAGADRVVCADVDQLTFAPVIANATSSIWTTTGIGTFSPNNLSPSPSYNADPTDITAGSVTITLTLSSGTCADVSDNMTITFTPVPTVSAGPDLVVCAGTVNVPVNGSSTNAPLIDWIVINPAIPTGNLTSLTALSTSYNLGADLTVTLQISSSGIGGCGTVSDDMTITIAAVLPIDAGADQTVCNSDLPIQLNATGTTGQWAASGGTFLPNDQTMNATYMPSAVEIALGTVTLTINTINNGICIAGSDAVTITINPGPVVTAGADQTICTNIPSVTLAGTQNAFSGGTTWTRVSSSGSFNNASLLAATYTPSAADYAAGIATLVITSNNPGCNPATDTMRVLIAPAPTVSLGPDLIRCGDAIPINLTAVTTNNNSIAWSIITGAGGIANGTTNTPTYTLGAEIIPGTITLQALVTPLVAAGTCNNVTRNINIALTPIPTVNGGGPVTTCLTSPNALLNGVITTAAGGTWTSSTGLGTFSPNANSVVATFIPDPLDLLTAGLTLTLTTTGNGQCATYTNVVPLTFDPLPIITSVPNRLVICSGNTVTFTSTITNITGVAWTTTGDGTFNTPTSLVTIYTPGPNDIANGGMIVTGTSTGPTTCAQDLVNTAIGIVPSPVASVNAGFDQFVCADIDTLQLNGFIAVALGGDWTASSGLGLFLPNASDLSAQYIPDPADKIGGTSITITLASTGNGICAPTSDDMIVNFTPIPTVDAGPDMIICADSAFLQLTPTITTATGGVWNTSGDINAFAPNATTAGAIYVPTAADIANGSIGFTLTTTGNGTCNAYQNSLAVTITAKPTIAIGPDLDVCANAATVSLNSTTTIANSTNWTTSGAGIFAPNPNNASVYSRDPSDTTAKTIVVFAESVNQGACKPAYDTLKINFQSTPIPDAGPDVNSCANLVAGTSLIGRVYNATGGLWSTGGSGSFSNPLSQLNNTYTPSPADKTAGTVTLSLTTTGNVKCNAIIDQVVISIAPTPIVTANPAIICDLVNGAALGGSVVNALGGIWSSSIAGGVFAPNSNTIAATYFPNATEIAAGKAILTLSSDGNGTCNTESKIINVVIESLPIADAGIDQSVCQNGTVTLSAFTEANKTYQWSTIPVAVFANTPNTSVVVGALTQYVLTASDAKGCNVNDTVQVDVFTMPTMNISPNPACFDRNLVLNSNAAPIPAVNGVFQWYRNNQIVSGENKTFITPATAGTYIIEYSYGTCLASALRVVNTPPSVISQDVTACNNNNTNLTVTNLANVTYSWTFNGAPVGGNTNAINVVTTPNDTSLYYVNVTDAIGCSTLDSIYLIGIPQPIVPNINDTLCEGAQVRLTARPTNIVDFDQFQKIVFEWRQDNTILSDIDSIHVATTTGIYRATVTIDQCSGFTQDTIVISPFPVSTLNSKATYCLQTNKFVVLDAGVATTYLWETGIPADTNQTLTVSPAQNRYYYVQIGNQFSCVTRDSIFVKNVCAPVIYIPNGFTPGVKGNDEIFKVFGSNFVNYKMIVFSRWGEVIFESTDRNIGWDGTYMGTDMQEGVYPVIITYEGEDQFNTGQQKYTGQVTLIR